MYVDVLVQVWQRLHINDEAVTQEQLIELLKETQPSVIGIYDITDNIDVETLNETETYVTTQEYENATLQLFDEDDKLIWQNFNK